jgi:hypothetical protein
MIKRTNNKPYATILKMNPANSKHNQRTRPNINSGMISLKNSIVENTAIVNASMI